MDKRLLKGFYVHDEKELEDEDDKAARIFDVELNAKNHGKGLFLSLEVKDLSKPPEMKIAKMKT
jgi:hypothetical protein